MAKFVVEGYTFVSDVGHRSGLINVFFAVDLKPLNVQKNRFSVCYV